VKILHSRIKNLSYHGIMVSEYIKYIEKGGAPVIWCSMMVTVDGKAKHLSAVRSLSRKPFTDALNEIVSIRDKLMEEYNITPLESLSIQDKTYLLQSLRNIINN
jgi:hypothetical protein